MYKIDLFNIMRGKEMNSHLKFVTTIADSFKTLKEIKDTTKLNLTLSSSYDIHEILSNVQEIKQLQIFPEIIPVRKYQVVKSLKMVLVVTSNNKYFSLTIVNVLDVDRSLNISLEEIDKETYDNFQVSLCSEFELGEDLWNYCCKNGSIKDILIRDITEAKWVTANTYLEETKEPLKELISSYLETIPSQEEQEDYLQDIEHTNSDDYRDYTLSCKLKTINISDLLEMIESSSLVRMCRLFKYVSESYLQYEYEEYLIEMNNGSYLKYIYVFDDTTCAGCQIMYEFNEYENINSIEHSMYTREKLAQIHCPSILAKNYDYALTLGCINTLKHGFNLD